MSPGDEVERACWDVMDSAMAIVNLAGEISDRGAQIPPWVVVGLDALWERLAEESG